MIEFFDRLFGRNGVESKAGSGKVAKDRLQFVLVQDRINLPAEKLQEMKKEILDVISKYVSVDAENVDFALSNRERSGLLIAEIPFKPVSDPTSERDEDISTLETSDHKPDSITNNDATSDTSSPIAQADASTSDKTQPIDAENDSEEDAK